jgi:hypothetical protein
MRGEGRVTRPAKGHGKDVLSASTKSQGKDVLQHVQDNRETIAAPPLKATVRTR